MYNVVVELELLVLPLGYRDGGSSLFYKKAGLSNFFRKEYDRKLTRCIYILCSFQQLFHISTSVELDMARPQLHEHQASRGCGVCWPKSQAQEKTKHNRKTIILYEMTFRSMFSKANLN